jgi:hypothetical protein
MSYDSEADVDVAIETPKEYRQTQRTDTILEARKDARNAFSEAVAMKRQYGSAMAALYVHRSVTSYVEELSFHMEKTKTGQPYWTQRQLGTIVIPPVEAEHEYPRGSSKDNTETKEWEPIQVIGIRDYLGLPEEITRQHTFTVFRGFNGYEDVTKTATTAVPIDISRAAYRATNHFAESVGIGLDIEEGDNKWEI